VGFVHVRVVWDESTKGFERVPQYRRIAQAPDPYQAAALAGLHYGSPEEAGYRRIRVGRGFAYADPDGDRAEIRRFRSLVIPPAWAQVWVSRDPTSHIQAVGWDAKGRKQYRYHPLYRDLRDRAKFDRMIDFGRLLSSVRARVREDLALRGLPQRKVVAVVVRLLEVTCIRIGNEEYERVNGSFGLTTLKSRHVTIEGSQLRFRFRGKSGQPHDILMRDTRLARIVRECQCIPGYELFQYKDETGEARCVRSDEVNSYLNEISEGNFTAKDFRTWVGTCAAAEFLRQREAAATQKDLKTVVTDVVKQVAARLGNKPATCRKYYIHPVVFAAFEDGTLFEAYGRESKEPSPDQGLTAEERALLSILESKPALLEAELRRRPRRQARSRSGRVPTTQKRRQAVISALVAPKSAVFEAVTRPATAAERRDSVCSRSGAYHHLERVHIRRERADEVL
jgi:DNA topoisomerase-1